MTTNIDYNPFGGDNVKTGIESFPEAPEFSYGVFKNGIFKKSKESIGVFTIKVADAPKFDMGLKEECSFSFERDESIPLIPYGVYEALINLYKEVFKSIRSEVYSMIFWDKVNQDFFIHVPPQKVSYASVKYEKDPEYFGNPNYIPVFENHLHSDFSAFFSGTDLKDEQDARYFAVIGKITSETPEFVARVASRGQALDLNFEDIFDIQKQKLHPTSNYSVNLEEALSVIQETISVSVTVKKKTPTYNPYYEDSLYYGATKEDVKFANHLTTSQAMFEYDVKNLVKRLQYNDVAVQNIAESLFNLIKDQYEEQVDIKEIYNDILIGINRVSSSGLLESA